MDEDTWDEVVKKWGLPLIRIPIYRFKQLLKKIFGKRKI